jgi:hypothetical protein
MKEYEDIREEYSEDEISKMLSQIALTHMIFIIDEDGDTTLVSSREITEDQAVIAERVALVLRDPSFMLVSFLFIENLLCKLMDYFTHFLETRR